MRGKSLAAMRARNLLSKSGYNFETIDLKDPNSCTIDVAGIAKQQDITVVPYAFSENISGVFFREDGKLFLGVNSGHNEHRRRFTIAHEIGHYILHASEKVHYDVSKGAKESLEGVYFRADDITGKDEIEANHFAAELLMPKDLVEKCIASGLLVISDLADRFNVSVDAMRYRLINLGYL